jgi:hypothetical protein
MEILNSMTLNNVIINIVIIIVLIMITRYFVIQSFAKSADKMSKKGKEEIELQKTKYLSWIDRFRDDYEKQIKYVQDFQVNLIKCSIYLLVLLLCQNAIDIDLNTASVIEIIFFIFGFILFIIMLWNIIKILPALLKTSKEINDFQNRNKISDEGLEIYDKKIFGATMKDVIGLRKENRYDKYDE